jgi:hypothetical protein
MFQRSVEPCEKYLSAVNFADMCTGVSKAKIRGAHCCLANVKAFVGKGKWNGSMRKLEGNRRIYDCLGHIQSEVMGKQSGLEVGSP